jgi:lactate permease
MEPGILAALAIAPLVAVFVLMAGLRWPAVRAMSVGWLLASGLGLTVWRLDWTWWAAAAIYGAMQAIEIVVIVFGALLLMNHLQQSGAIAAIRWHLSGIADDRRIQLLLIGLGFITIVEGAAGFGTPGALAAPLLIGLGFPTLAAAVFGLFFNALQPPFGAAGTPISGGIGSVIGEATLAEGMQVADFLAEVSTWTAVLTGSALVCWGALGVFLFTLWFGKQEARSLAGAWRATLPVLPFAVFLGSTAGVTQFLVAWLIGPELPDLAAGFVTLGLGVLAARKGVLMPKQTWRFPERELWPEAWLGGGEVRQLRKEMPVLLAWTPYLLVATILIVTRWPGLGISGWLRSFAIELPRILGQDLGYSLSYLYLPGILPFIPVAIVTWAIHRISAAKVRTAWTMTFKQLLKPAATLIVAVSMTQVIILSDSNPLDLPGMMQALSRALAAAAGPMIPLVAPWIGALGAFITGSTTSSNILFSALQHDSAQDAGVSRILVVALQNVGAGIGNMVSVLNIAAICGVIGATGSEGVLLRKIALPTLLVMLLAGLAGLALTGLQPGLY